MSACCCIYEYEGDGSVFYPPADLIKRARKEHTCIECERTIPIGAPYERQRCVDREGGRSRTYTTCMLCRSVRDDLMECGFAFGHVWRDIGECLAEVGEDDSWLDPPTHPIEVRDDRDLVQADRQGPSHARRF